MTVVTEQRRALAMTIPEAPVWRLSLEQYHHMLRLSKGKPMTHSARMLPRTM